MAVFCKSYQPLYDVYAPWVSLVNLICFRKDAPSHVVLPQSLPRSPEKQADQVEEHQARCSDVWSVSFERNFNLEQARSSRKTPVQSPFAGFFILDFDWVTLAGSNLQSCHYPTHLHVALGQAAGAEPAESEAGAQGASLTSYLR
jgi:hypothetical protein